MRPDLRIWICGDYSAPTWKGSATTTILKVLASSLALRHLTVQVVENPRPRSRLQRLFGSVHESADNNIVLLSGGVVPLVCRMLRDRPQLLHVQVARPWMIPLCIVARMAGIKIVHSVHDLLFIRFRNEVSWRTLVVRQLSVIISHGLQAMNSKDAEELRHRWPRKLVSVIPNGIDQPDAQPDVQVDEVVRAPRILFAGGLGQSHKGLAFLESALLQLDMTFELIICGDNPWNLTHPAYIGALSTEEYIRQLRRARMLVVPSKYESFSLSALEALSIGVPIVLTRECGIAEGLHDRSDCMLVAHGDTSALTEAIRTVLQRDDVYTSLREGGIRASRQWSVRRMTQEMYEHYSTLLDPRTDAN